MNGLMQKHKRNKRLNKCVLDDVSGNYIWTSTNTQKASEDDGKITEDIKVYGVCDQLGYSDGDIITKGKDYTSILKKLLQRIIEQRLLKQMVQLKQLMNIKEKRQLM